MASPKKPLDPDYLFNILKLNKWFAISSILLLLGVFGMIGMDYQREWKGWQRKFRSLERERTRSLTEEEAKALAANPDYQTALADFKRDSSDVEAHEIEKHDLEKKIEKLQGSKYAINVRYQAFKSVLDAEHYDLEEAIAHHHKNVEKVRKRYQKTEKAVQAEQKALDESDQKIAQVQLQLDTLVAKKKDADARVQKLQTKLIRLERKQKLIARSLVNDVLRDMPMLDFVVPSLKVKEIVVRDLMEDYNFTKIPRADNCTTCHVAIDVEGYEEGVNPLKTHPNLALYMSSKSRHPIDQFGCTVCHAGMGGGLTFTAAGHMPQTPEQGETWKKKYHWHRLTHWASPMLPLKHTESSCLGCHMKDLDVANAPQLTKGIVLLERSGCNGCHKIAGWEDVRKRGPWLRRIASKVSEDWMTKWIREPRSFRPHTTMPQFFDLTNTNDEHSKKQSAAMIAGIVTYLRSKSEAYQPIVGPSSNGDIERGKQLFSSVGCLGCHMIDDFPAEKPRMFGPELSQVGSKLDSKWLAQWIRNPKEYWPETRMPDLRLSEAQISDLVAYLMSKKNPKFDALEVPKLEPKALAEVTLDFLSKRMPLAQAQNQLRKMSPDEKLMLVGERSISHFGCFGCHDIGGFEDAKPIGTELTVEASKPISQFDFGYVDIEHTTSSWLRQKVKDPRIYDLHRVKEPLDKLKMPNFHFTEEETDAITTLILGLRKYDIPEMRKPEATPFRSAIREGRRLIHDRNCRGCHIIEGQGGDILAHYEDPSLGPPNLNGEGRKVQSDWLFHFLKNPSTVRPWLTVRMPSFEFSEAETNTVIRYFRALDNMRYEIETQPQISQTGSERSSGSQVFATLQCMRCHIAGAIPKDTDTSNLAPSFKLTRNRLRYEWIADWLRDPQKLLPGTRMPGFFYSDGQAMFPNAEEQIKAVRDHVWTMQ